MWLWRELEWGRTDGFSLITLFGIVEARYDEQRMRSALCLILLLCCLGLCGLWARSYWWSRDFGFRNDSREGLTVITSEGRAYVDLRVPTYGPLHWHCRAEGAMFLRYLSGGSLRWFEGNWNGRHGYVTFPLALPAAVAALPPTLWAYRRRRLGKLRGFPPIESANTSQ